MAHLIKNLLKMLERGGDEIASHLNKHPIKIRSKDKNYGATIGGKVSKKDMNFIKSGKKFKVEVD
jgi:hypothetical protein